MRAAADWHGSAGGYANHHCRCAACRGAWAAYYRSLCAVKKARRLRCKHPKWSIHRRGNLAQREICAVCRKTRKVS